MPYLIYLLSGLLVFHGIVCLLGAFFPFYPPVFLFYAFFPGHFAIRLIIILITGAAQIAYGLHLILRKRWRIRWYWPAVAAVVITGLLLIYPASHGLFAQIPAAAPEPPPYPSARPGPERPDDIVSTPGGPQYRANVHQAGIENPWPPIKTKEEFLDENVICVYRAYIETEAREARNNIVRVVTPGRDITDLELSISDVPSGTEVKQGIEWHGPHSIAQVLIMEISPDVQPGQYSFGIGIEVDGKDYGTVPCTIEVSDRATLSNHGITDITIQPEPGQILVYDKEESAGVILKSVTIKSDVCDKDYFDRPRDATIRKGEPCLLITGQVESQLDQDKYMTLSARGYDVNGEEVTYVLDAGPIWGVISVFAPAKDINEFVLHLKTAPDVRKIELMPSPELYDIPPP